MGRRQNIITAISAFFVLVSGLYITPAKVYAADDYPGYDNWGFAIYNCTSFAAWRVNRDKGTTSAPYFFKNDFDGNSSLDFGHAHNWDNAAITFGFQVDSTPRPGSIALWEQTPNIPLGHVAYVESVNSDASVNVSEYNWGLPSPTLSYGTRSSIRADKYIHFNNPVNYSHYFVDVNADGVDDLIQISKGIGMWTALADPITGNINVWSHYTDQVGEANGQFKHYFAKLNNDNAYDLVQISNTLGMWTALSNPSTGASNIWSSYTNQVGEASGTYKHYFADVDGDGDSDLIQMATNIGMWIGLTDSYTGNINVWNHYTNQVGEANGTYKHYFAKLNNDNAYDLIQISRTTGTWTGLADPVSGAFNVWSTYNSGVGESNGAYRHYFADVDGDNDSDFIQISTTTGMWIGITDSATGNINIWSTYNNQVGESSGSYRHYFTKLNDDNAYDLVQISKTTGIWTALASSGSFNIWSSYSNQVGEANGQFKHYFAKLNSNLPDSDRGYDLIQVAQGRGMWTGLADLSTGNLNIWSTYTDQVGW